MAIKVYCPKCKKEVFSGFYNKNGDTIAYHGLPIKKIGKEYWGCQRGTSRMHKINLGNCHLY